ncbi:MAG: MFS transporter [Chloroflexi bacterium]|nr:MFS transporter [Chloroflexota bacterium]
MTLSKDFAPALVKPEPKRRLAPLATLSAPGYRYLWSASLLWNQARWMDRVVLGWVVFDMTNSAWNLAVLEALRWLPLLLFGLAGGAVADRIDRRWVLIGAQGLALLVCSLSAVLLLLGLFDFRVAMFVTFALGVQWAVDWPTRRALIPDLVGRDLTMNAVALEAVSQNVTRIAGPLMAGVLVAYVSSAAAFAAMAALYVVEIVLLKLMPLRPRSLPARRGSMLRYLSDGFERLSASQAIVGVVLVSVFMNVLVFPYQQLLPVFARDSLQVDAVGLGGLSAASGLGSVVGAMAIAMSRRVPRSGMVFWVGSCVMSVCVIGFAASQQYGVALVLLAMSGLGQAAFSSLQSTIVLSSATDQLRGRAMGALTLAIGSTPFGSLEVGALSVALGATLAVALNAGLCAVLVVLVALRLPRFRTV